MTDADGTSNASSVTDHLRSDDSDAPVAVERVIAWIALVFAVGGLALGLVPMVYGSYGETQFETPGSNHQGLSDEQETVREAEFKNTAITAIVNLVPYLAVPFGIAIGFVAGVVHGGRSADVAIGIAAGTFVGVVAFVFLSSVIAMQQWWVVGDGLVNRRRWLQWDSVLRNAALIALPTALLAPIAGIAGSGLRS